MKHRVLLVEGNSALRQELREILAADPEFEVVAETGSSTEALVFALRHNPDIVIVAYDLPGSKGLDVTARLLTVFPKLIVIVIGMNDDERYVSQVRSAGALGYVLKNEAADRLLDVIRAARQGSQSISAA